MNNRTAMVRIYLVHQEISTNHYPNVPSLMAQLECSESTVRRDLESMRDQLGAPLVFDRRKGGYYYATDYQLPAVVLNKEELEAIWVAHEWLRQSKGTPYEQAVQRAWEKLSIWFGLDQRLLENWSVISVAADPLRGAPQVIERNFRGLEKAIQQRRVVCIEYYSPATDTVTTREIEPYSIHLADGACYCVAFCRLRNDQRTFAVDRIRKMEVTEEPFQLPADFSLEEYLRGSLGVMRGEVISLEICFSAEQARYLDEHPQHTSQRRLSEGSAGVVYGFELADNLETLRWVFSFGASATVLVPEHYVARVRKEFMVALTKY